MELTSANLNTNNTIFVDRLTTNNVTVNSREIAISGTPVVNNSQMSIGSVSLTPMGISTPALFIGGSLYGAGAQIGGVVNAQFFTANGTWIKPTSANNADNRNQVLIMAWGAGGNGITDYGGGGGSCFVHTIPLSSFDSTCQVVVGPTGGAQTTFVVNSTVSITAFGGAAASGSTGGGGGGIFSAGSGRTGGGLLGGNTTVSNSTFGGGAGANNTVGAGVSIFGGGGGGRTGGGANSIYGGGGGGGISSAGGVSILGGNGGTGSSTPATAPGGGGAGESGNLAGARGEVRAWVIGPGPIQSSYQPVFETYAISPNTSVHYEGNTVTFNITTVGVANNTTLYYTLNNSSTAVAADFTTAVNGSINVVSGSASFTLTANNSTAIEADRTYFMDLRVGSTTGSIVARTSNVTMVHSVKDIVYRTVTSTNTTTSSHTYNNIDIGVPSLNRTVVFLVASQGRSIGSVNVNGVAATPVEQRNSTQDVAFYTSNIPTGTTANVVVNAAAPSFVATALATWSVYNLSNTTPVTTNDAGNQNFSLNNISPGDIVIAMGSTNDSTRTGTLTSGNLGLALQFTRTAREVAGTSDDLIVRGAHVKTSNAGNFTIQFENYNITAGIALR